MCANAQTAADSYLDITNHATIASAAGSSYKSCTNLYEFDAANKVLVLSAYAGQENSTKNEGTQAWITYTEKGSTAVDDGWNAQDVFKGSAFYVLTSSGNASNRAAAVNQNRETSYRIKGINKVSALVNANHSSRLVILNVYEVIDGVRAEAVTATQQTTGKENVVLAIENLESSNIYDVAVTGTTTSNTRVLEIAFYQDPDYTPTGISNITSETAADADAPVYNLAGQQVTKSYKGVCIQNGRKFINK